MTRMRRKATVHLVEVDPGPRIRGIVRHGDQWTRIWQAEATARRRLIGAPFSVWRLAALPRSEAWPETLDRLGRRP